MKYIEINFEDGCQGIYKIEHIDCLSKENGSFNIGLINFDQSVDYHEITLEEYNKLKGILLYE